MATGERRDPYRAFNFQLEIDNVPLGAFSECSGLTAEGDAVDYREGTDRQPNVRKLVGLRKYTNITLKRGYTQDKSLWAWYTNIFNGIPDRRNVTIVLMNEQRQPVLRWHAENAWVNKIEGPSFKASGNEVAMESVELVHEGLTIETS
ncbi:MAG: phage tail protein [Methylobacter sp.]|jgi:phage tail-like protein|uniref:phage tail protein n=1 Tax=Methylobacter sp. TaxID=2051955 RepID=UPI0025CCE0CC|nr:phage tail protein [Methylobacter sp.]MCK9621355.1 phage tail protein [Methylobacter sp.]